MPRLCKCHATGERGDVKSFYRPSNEKYYFKDKETYETWKIEEDLRKMKSQKRREINDKIAEFIRYEKGQTFPTNICRTIKELEVFYGLDVILETMNESAANIQWAMDNKEFKNEYGKCNYLMAIVKNNINDVWKRKKREKKEVENINRVLNSEDIDVSMPVNKPIKNKKTDISQFLDEDDNLWN